MLIHRLILFQGYKLRFIFNRNFINSTKNALKSFLKHSSHLHYLFHFYSFTLELSFHSKSAKIKENMILFLYVCMYVLWKEMIRGNYKPHSYKELYSNIKANCCFNHNCYVDFYILIFLSHLMPEILLLFVWKMKIFHIYN